VLYGALVLLFTNVPSGMQGKVGYGLEPLALFRRVFPYPTISFSAAVFTAGALACFVGLWGLYLVAFKITGRVPPSDRPASLRTIFAAAVLHRLLLIVLLPPVLSEDLYHYAAFGRMVAFEGMNPYASTVSSLPPHPVTALANWSFLSSHYGAFFTWISAGASWLGGEDPVRTAFAFKGIAAAADLTIPWLAYRLVEDVQPQGGLGAFSLCALAPIFAIESAGNGHNEALMMALALLGVLLWQRGQIAAGTAALTLSMLVKLVTGIVPLLLLSRSLAQAAGWRHRLALLATVVGVAGMMTLLLYAPFDFDPRGWGITASRKLVIEGQGLVGGARPAIEVRFFLFGALGAAALVVAIRARASYVMELSATLSLVFVLLVFDWIFCWYFIPAMVLAIAAPPSRTREKLRFGALALAGSSSLVYALLT
jgi:hypothetical protein